MVNKKSPIANVTITLEVILSTQDTVVMTTTSDNNGAFQFEVNYTEKSYNVVFSLESNPQLTPASDYVAWSWIESELIDDIEIPDLEISSAPDGDLFEQSQPPNNGSYSASQISFQNPLTFEWNSYPQGEQYWVDLGRQGEERTLWSSLAVMDLFVDFDGTLDDDTKISQGTYWWAVGSLQSPPGFRIFTYTHDWTLVISP